jgi:hypothetical protein
MKLTTTVASLAFALLVTSGCVDRKIFHDDASTADGAGGVDSAGKQGVDAAGALDGIAPLDVATGEAANAPDVPISADAPAIVADSGPTQTGGATGTGGIVATGGSVGLDAPAASGGAGSGGVGGGTGGKSGIDAPVANGGASTGGTSGGAGGATAGTGGATALLGNGSTCTEGTACLSSVCADGVCCNNTCAGCNACTKALSGQADGSCAPVSSGLDPHNSCANETATNQCGNDGTCDGNSACHKVATSHQCTPASCSGGTFTAASNCTGTGACATVAPQSCGAFQCSITDGCKTTCTTPSDCGTGSYCNTTTGSCLAKLAPGATCSAGVACPTGSCVDGVCCESACTGTCQACSAAKTGSSDGLCRPIKAGTDPDNECAQDPSNTCGLDGTCNGIGACRYTVAGTGCGRSSCTGQGMLTPAGQCNGSGACLAATTSNPCPNNMPCASNSTCATTCTDRSTDGCPPGYTCWSGTACVQTAVPCGGTSCQVGNGGQCCVTYSDSIGDNPVQSCLAAGQSCTGAYQAAINCGSGTDCPAGSICCLSGNGASTWSASCNSDPASCKTYSGPYTTVFGYQVCDAFLSGPTECLSGTCQTSGFGSLSVCK